MIEPLLTANEAWLLMCARVDQVMNVTQTVEISHCDALARKGYLLKVAECIYGLTPAGKEALMLDAIYLRIEDAAMGEALIFTCNTFQAAAKLQRCLSERYANLPDFYLDIEPLTNPDDAYRLRVWKLPKAQFLIPPFVDERRHDSLTISVLPYGHVFQWAIFDAPIRTLYTDGYNVPSRACAEWCGLTTASAIQLGLVDPAKFGAYSPVDDDEDFDGTVCYG